MLYAKDKIRRDILSQRLKMPSWENSKKSQDIRARIFSFTKVAESFKLLFYMSIKNEVATVSMIEEARKRGKQIYLPRVNMEKSCLNIYKVDSMRNLTKGYFSVLEPDPNLCEKGDVNEMDLCLIPGISFDMAGNRVGYGKGFYDRLLSHETHLEALKVGLAFDFQVVPEILASSFDVKVDKIVTETRIIDCNITI